MKSLSDHQHRFQVLRKHPILKQLENQLNELNDKATLNIFTSHIAFMYPKILLFTFNGLTDSYDLLEDVESSNQPNDDTDSGNIIIETGYHRSNLNDHNTIVSFTHNLISCLDKISFHPLILIDLRNIRVLDKSIINKIINLMLNNNLSVLLLVSPNTSNLLKHTDYFDKVILLQSVSQLRKKIDEYLCQVDNILKIEIRDKLTLNRLEVFFDKLKVNDKVKDKYIIDLDFTYTTDLSFFSISLLNILCHSISHRYGIMWRITSEANNDIHKKLSDYRVFDINKFILVNDVKVSDPSSNNVCGIYVFDETQQSKVIRIFDKYITNLCHINNKYLNKIVTITYDDKFTSRKSQTRQLPIYSFITSLVYELIDNVTLHSEGLGYFSAFVTKQNILCIFVGDSGIGLKRGILKNYSLSNEIITSKNAIDFCFNLSKYAQNRKKGYDFNIGSEGFGLSDSLSCIFTCKGKLLFRTGKAVGSFVNPVSKLSSPSKTLESNIEIDGTQYMILIPLSDSAIDMLPRGTDDLLSMEV